MLVIKLYPDYCDFRRSSRELDSVLSFRNNFGYDGFKQSNIKPRLSF